jgi:hypothetical protein
VFGAETCLIWRHFRLKRPNICHDRLWTDKTASFKTTTTFLSIQVRKAASRGWRCISSCQARPMRPE